MFRILLVTIGILLSAQIQSQSDDIGSHSRNSKFLDSEPPSVREDTSFYEGGKVKSIQRFRGDVLNGNASYFDKRGNKVALVKFEDGNLSETLLVDTNVTILIGQLRQLVTPIPGGKHPGYGGQKERGHYICLLYTSDAADES